MPPKRPTSVLVISILHFVFGGLGVCLSGYQLSGAADLLVQAGRPAQGQPQISAADLPKYVEKREPNYKLYEKGSAALGLLLSLMMVMSGIGLLRVQAWGRLLSIAYAIPSILAKVFELIYGLIFVVPAAGDLARDLAADPANAPPGFAQGMETGMQAGAIIGLLVSFLTIAYPIIVLIIMFRPNVVAAFRGETLGPAIEDYDDRFPQGRPAPPDDRFQGGDRP